MRIMKNNRRVIFFDVIIGAMILMIGFKIMFPNALGGSAAPALPDYELPHYGDYIEVGVSLDAYFDPVTFNPVTNQIYAFTVIADCEEIDLLCDNSFVGSSPAYKKGLLQYTTLTGVPYCYIGNDLYYIFHYNGTDVNCLWDLNSMEFYQPVPFVDIDTDCTYYLLDARYWDV